MTDTSILARNVEVDVLATNSASGRAALSWSSAIAGAIAAAAVSFLIISLGSGIGLSLASPFRSTPSGTALTIMGAVWLVMAQAFGFATGGYLAARLRLPVGDRWLRDETTFRDAAEGFMVWAIGVAFAALVAAWIGLAAAGSAVQSGATLAAGFAPQAGSAESAPALTAVDALLRPAPTASAAPSPAPGGVAATQAPPQPPSATDDESLRAELGRIAASVAGGEQLSGDDRTYLGQVVARRTGLSQEDAERRVDDVVNRLRQRAAEVADQAAKAAAMLSFWTFMSLLIGTAAAVLGGIVGGELRDQGVREPRRP